MIRKNSQKGIAQLAIIAVMAFLALGLPAATKLVQQNQENRSKASESDISINGICGTANGKTFSSLSLEKDDHTLFCQKSSGVTITKVSENNYSWKCIGINGGMTVDCSATIDPNSNTANASISATKTDLYYRFKESNDTRVLGVGMTVFSTIRLNTYEKSISSAKIVYCHTDKLEPILDSVRGEQLNTVVSHKKIDNNCAELKVNFDINKKLTGNTAYEIKIATKIVKTGSGTLSFNVPNSSVLGLNGEIVKFTEFTYGADFKIESDEIISKLTPTPIPSSPYLYFNPQNKNTKMGDIFEVTAGIDSSSNIIGGVDIVGTYDSSKLELISIKKSPSMVFNNKGDCTNPENITPGKFSLTCFISDSRDSMMVKGDLVKLTFKAKSAGSAKIEFSCQNNNLTDSNISNPNIFQDIIACNKNIKANISITGATVINGVCGTVKFSELSINSGKEKPQLLCKSGGLTAFEVNPTKDYYYWTCYGINGGTSTVCGVAKPSNNTAIDGVCGSIKYSELTLTSDKDKPEILCKSGKVVGFERSGANVTDRVPLYYSWDCLGLNGGDTVGCGVNPPATPQKVINGVCGSVKYSQLSKNSPSDKSITLCKSGKLDDFFTMYERPSSTELTYVWNCLGSNGGRNIQCNVSNTAQKIDGACGSLKYSDITPDINKTNPTLLCKSGKLINFVGVTPNCITGPNCPPANYSWSCIGTNGGKSVKCTKYGNPVINPPIPATKVRVTPIFTRLKVGQSRILTYTLTPSSSTDIVKWVTFGNGLVEIEKTATNQLKITALKAGSIRIKITTSSGKSAQSIIFINK